MKSITEFPNFVLQQAIQLKAGLVADGKTPEEISQSIGEKYKYEGDKLKYFVNAIGVAEANKENLKRVLVVSLAEGENAPPKATQVEEAFYIPEGLILTKMVVGQRPEKKGRDGKGGRGGKKGERKSSPWGLSPEEKSAKTKKPEAPKA